MLNKNFIKKVSSVALTGAVFAVSLLSFNSASANNVVAATSKLEITNTVDNAQADRGETLSYTIVVKNSGDTALDNTYVKINTPNLANYVNGSGSYIFKPTPNITRTLTDAWVEDGVNFGTLQPNETVTLKYKTVVANNANQDDILWSVAAAKSDQTSQVQANSWTRVILKNPGICAEKTADKTTVQKGDVVTFTIKVCNKGNVVLHDILIGDLIHAPLQYVAGSTELTVGSQVTKVADSWLQTSVNIGDLNPGQEAFLRFKVTVGTVTDGQTIQNVAQVKSNETPEILKCAVYLKGKVLGITTPPTELPKTGPELLLLIPGLVPAGLALKKFKSRI